MNGRIFSLISCVLILLTDRHHRRAVRRLPPAQFPARILQPYSDPYALRAALMLALQRIRDSDRRVVCVRAREMASRSYSYSLPIYHSTRKEMCFKTGK